MTQPAGEVRQCSSNKLPLQIIESSDSFESPLLLCLQVVLVDCERNDEDEEEGEEEAEEQKRADRPWH